MAKKKATKHKAAGDPVAAGAARVAERASASKQVAAARALEQRVQEICDVLAAPTSYTWPADGTRGDLVYEATRIVDGGAQASQAVAGSLEAALERDRAALRDRRWRELREQLGDRIPEERCSANAQAWAPRRAAELLLDGLWVPLADAIREQGTAEKWLAAASREGLAERLRHLEEAGGSTDAVTIVAVGRQLLQGLFGDPWEGDSISRELRERLVDQLVTLRGQLPGTFGQLGQLAETLRSGLFADQAAPGVRPSRPPEIELKWHDKALALLVGSGAQWPAARIAEAVGVKRSTLYTHPRVRTALMQRGTLAAVQRPKRLAPGDLEKLTTEE